MSNETENNLEINRQPDPAATLKSARDSVWVINDNLQKLNNGQQFTNDIKGIYRDWETDRKSTRLNSSH